MTQALNDTRRFYKECRDAGTEGVHSWDCYGWTRNASQRAKDVTTKGFQIWSTPERRNGRPGARYWLDGFQPDYAEPVKPNHPSGVEGGDGTAPTAMGGRAAASSGPGTVVALNSRPCRRCDNGKLANGLDCPACFGEGKISARRINSFIDEQVAA